MSRSQTHSTDQFVSLRDRTSHSASRLTMRIATIEDNATVLFAAAELEKYLHRISGGTAIHVREEAYSSQPDTLWVGCAASLGDLALPPVEDYSLDDAIAISVEDREGRIAGANPRAVLLAVYRYLTELGCRWIRPGDDGEIIPAIPDPLGRNVRVCEAPSYRHRGLAIEGACSCEHVTDLIAWLPKVGMNSYFMEYFSGYIFYNNWYSRRHEPANAAALMPEERATEFAERAIEEVQRRDLLFHRAGHGWTCIPLGIEPGLWDEQIDRDFGDMTRYIALYEGKRELYHGIPRRTNLCYSQLEVRKMVVAGTVAYAAAHPEVDYLHFWLADGTNHFCECEACQQQRPSDFYVMMLNELDQALSERGLATRIVFLIYADLLWAPAEQEIRHPERFVLMFAPLHRSYYEPFDPAEMEEPIPPFALNELEFPPSQNLNHLAAWQHMFSGDSFVFDYRLMWGQYDDPGYMALSRALDADLPSLREVGLNGMISDQTQRVFIPSGLSMMLLAKNLWQSDLDYDAAADDYFSAAFGPDGDKCRDYLEGISAGFNPRWLSTYQSADPTPVPDDMVTGLREVRELIEEFEPVIEENLSLANYAQARSWEYLAEHAQMCRILSRAIEAELDASPEQAQLHWQELQMRVMENEDDTNPVFDVFLFLLTMRRKFQISPSPPSPDM